MTTDKSFYERLIKYNQSGAMTTFPDTMASEAAPPIEAVEPAQPAKRGKWESKAQPHTDKLKELESQWLQISKDADTEYEKLVTELTPKLGFDPSGTGIQVDISAGARAKVNRDTRAKINDITNQVEYNSFYQSLYSNTPLKIEAAKMLGQPLSVEDLMPTIPSSMPFSEVQGVRDTINQMISDIEPSEEQEQQISITPKLNVPVPSSGFPIAMSQLTGNEIAKALMQPVPPMSSWTTKQFQDYLLESGQITKGGDEAMKGYFQQVSQELIANEVQRDINIKAMKEAGAVLPARTFMQYFSEFMLEPMASASELMMPYFEHTTMPLAQQLWGNVFRVSALRNDYQHYMAQGMDSIQARSKAWSVWNPPGPGATDFMLKYILTETITDPITWATFGVGLMARAMVVGAKGATMLGGLGRTGSAISRVSPYLIRGSEALSRTGWIVGKVIDYPFDWLKGVGELIPKTSIQTATVFGEKATRAVQAYVSGEVSVMIDGKMTHLAAAPLYTRTRKEFNAIISSAIETTLRRGDTNTPAVRAGRELLAHAPISEEDVIDWASKLGVTMRKGDNLTMLRSQLDELFELYFKRVDSQTKLLESPAMSGYMVRLLTGNNGDAKSLRIAQLLLESRTKSIIRSANTLAGSDSPRKALSALFKRNYDISLAADDFVGDMGRLYQSHSNRLLIVAGDLTDRTILAWQHTIDAWITRPFAQSYLAFALYGPFNIMEDLWRSWMGDVTPGIASAEEIAWLTVGLNIDDALRDVSVKGIVESTGTKIVAKGTPHGWLLDRLVPFGWGKKWAELTMDKPGMVSQGIRRNFWVGKFQDEMYKNGGDTVKALHTLVTDYSMPTNIPPRLRKQIQTVAYRAAIGGDKQAMKNSATLFIRKKIMERDLNTIRSQHPEVPSECWDDIMSRFHDNSLFPDIDGSVKGTREIAIKSFLKGPQRFTESLDSLTNLFMSMEIKNPQEMATLVNGLRYAEEMAGATPKQILARATIYSRGLPLEQRRPTIDNVLDNINKMVDDANVNIDKLVGKIRQTMNAPESVVGLTPDMPGAAISQHNLGYTPDYTQATNRLLDIQTAKRLKLSTMAKGINTSRQDFWTGISKTRMKTSASEVYDEYYDLIDGLWDEFNVEAATFDSQILQQSKLIDRVGGIGVEQPPVRVQGVLCANDIGQLLGVQGDDISRGLLSAMIPQNDKRMFVEYVWGHVRPDIDSGFTREGIGQVYDQIWDSLHATNDGWMTRTNHELEAVRTELHDMYNSKQLSKDELYAIQQYFNGLSEGMDGILNDTTKLPKGITSYNELRQQCADAASKWYYKEYTDYTHANGFDAMMKLIYPFWTYESQRWMWLPRSFIRKPATFTALTRWQNNSDNGYIHIPDTSFDISPFRGTIYGALTGRLSKRDYPDYYDQLGIMGDVEGFTDMFSRYGFYPGAIYNLAMTALGGEPLWGEQLPTIFKTPMDMLRVALPDNKLLEWIDSRIMGDRLRDYMTSTVMSRMGLKGSLVLAKMQAKEELTPEEQQAFTDARREVSWYSILFEQFSVLRLRPQEYIQIHENCAELIHQLYGFTPEQQEEARARGINLSDLVGGMSKRELAMLEELGYYKYAGRARPLMPQSQQEMSNKLELAWSKVEEYSTTITKQRALVEREFLAGRYTNDDYTNKIRDLQDKQHGFVIERMREVTTEKMPKDLSPDQQEEWLETHSPMSLEGKKEYLKAHGIAIPVTNPMTELTHLYYSIKLKEVINPETGRPELDWDTYWAEKQIIENAIPDQYKAEWAAIIEKDYTPLDKLRKEVSTNYFKVYNGVYDAVLKTYTPDEQRAINEYYYLKGTNRNVDRQQEIQDMVDAKSGKQLISSYGSEITAVRKQLRYANPMLDAWLYFWGKTSTLITPQSEDAYKQIARQTGRVS